MAGPVTLPRLTGYTATPCRPVTREQAIELSEDLSHELDVARDLARGATVLARQLTDRVTGSLLFATTILGSSAHRTVHC